MRIRDGCWWCCWLIALFLALPKLVCLCIASWSLYLGIPDLYGEVLIVGTCWHEIAKGIAGRKSLDSYDYGYCRNACYFSRSFLSFTPDVRHRILVVGDAGRFLYHWPCATQIKKEKLTTNSEWRTRTSWLKLFSTRSRSACWCSNRWPRVRFSVRIAKQMALYLSSISCSDKEYIQLLRCSSRTDIRLPSVLLPPLVKLFTKTCCCWWWWWCWRWPVNPNLRPGLNA